MNHRVWTVAEPPTGPAGELARALHISTVLAGLLISRGVESPEAARAFLTPSLDQLHDPMLLPQMEIAVERIRRALDNKEKLLVYGDYDVDGTTGAALLTRVLRALGGAVTHRVPHRRREGYDLHLPTVEEAHAAGITLIVTVDCGSSALDAIARANELGVDVVVTDHHEPGPQLPTALAIVNPHRRDSQYPFPELAGVGVALKLAQALARSLNLDENALLLRFSDLAALGTVADVMPLVGENRVIVAHGLRALPTSQKLGLRALAQVAGFDGKKTEVHHLSFGLAPRLNAIGRMDDANLALELLLTKDSGEASQLAKRLDDTNRQRQDEQARILEQALEQVADHDLADTRVLVLSSPGWHPGVIGIVASKIAETYLRPAILIAEDENVGRGSCRSIAGFHICDALGECGEFLARFGGHAMAAGFDIPLEHLEAFRARVNQIGRLRITDEDLVPEIHADMLLEPAQIGIRLVEELDQLAPFGQGNPRPLFITRAVELAGCATVGSAGIHLKLRVRGENAVPVDCMGWRMGSLCKELTVGERYDFCYELEINSFNGNRSAQMILKDLKPTESTKDPPPLATPREG